MIPLCPVCGYSLRGLPEDHQCPECGLRYDAASEIYFHANPRALWGAMVGSMGTAAWLGYWAQGWKVAGSVGRVIALAGLLACVSGIGVAGFQIWTVVKRGALVAVMPDGLFLRLDRAGGAWIRWDNITRASVLPKLRVSSLFIKDARVVRSVGGVFKTHDDARRFVDQVNQRVRPGFGNQNGAPESS